MILPGWQIYRGEGVPYLSIYFAASLTPSYLSIYFPADTPPPSSASLLGARPKMLKFRAKREIIFGGCCCPGGAFFRGAEGAAEFCSGSWTP